MNDWERPTHWATNNLVAALTRARLERIGFAFMRHEVRRPVVHRLALIGVTLNTPLAR